MDRRRTVNLSVIVTLLAQFLVVSYGHNQYRQIVDGASDVESFLIPPEELTQVEKRFPPHLDPNLMNFWIRIGECPETADGAKQYYCPSLNKFGRHVCIDDHQLCNGVKECPHAEDENGDYCLFYRALRSQVQMLERSVTTLNSNSMQTPVRRYSNSFGRTIHGYD